MAANPFSKKPGKPGIGGGSVKPAPKPAPKPKATPKPKAKPAA